jgi:hypothetical protein
MNGDRTDFFVSLETRVWEALAAGDGAADGALLSLDFLGVYPSGFSDRDDHVAQLADGPTVATYEIRDARLRELTDDHVLLSYEASWRRTPDGVSETMFISSLWSSVDGEWINVFSQDTPAA